MTLLPLLATTTVVSGTEALSSCQISPDQLQRSWFGVTSAMSKPVVLTELLLLLGMQPTLTTSLLWRLVKAAVLVGHVDGLTNNCHPSGGDLSTKGRCQTSPKNLATAISTSV